MNVAPALLLLPSFCILISVTQTSSLGIIVNFNDTIATISKLYGLLKTLPSIQNISLPLIGCLKSPNIPFPSRQNSTAPLRRSHCHRTSLVILPAACTYNCRHGVEILLLGSWFGTVMGGGKKLHRRFHTCTWIWSERSDLEFSFSVHWLLQPVCRVCSVIGSVDVAIS